MSGVCLKEGTHVMDTPQVYILGLMSYLSGSDLSIIHKYILLQHMVLLPLHLSAPDPYIQIALPLCGVQIHYLQS